ncbi:hypothetical protein [Flavobacterium coralii]|uniref:hypothetical protein n=1 Tax=Flavobacterium coralii TaxID=2838017 RepID=UPI000C41B2BB|nr:hypothetical protein [Flavobacterium sp.]|tara:strand:- start:23521 stop:23949 length:429 start_codon:yes stop_codon:yes gene_type:complete
MIIGIDPDTNKSGVAIKDDLGIELKTLKFFELFDLLKGNATRIRKVRIEASWLIKSNWHKKVKGSAAVNARIGNHTGSNHETGRKIVEMCQYLKIPYDEVKPLKKIWKGPDKKITHEELSRMVPNLPNRTNSEQRDACLLIL